MSKLVRVCPVCSKVDIYKLKEQLGKSNVKSGCVGACRKDRSKYFGK